MNFKVLVLSLVLAFIALAPIFYVGYYYGDKIADPATPTSDPVEDLHEFPLETQLEPGSEIRVQACKVLDGYRYDLYLEGGHRITAHLSAATKDEAKSVVASLLQEAVPPTPTVILKRQVDSYWIVDFHLTVNGNRSSMLELLRAQGLLL